MDELHESPPTLTRQAVRELDRVAMNQLGMSGLVLMENAGRGVVDCLRGQGDLNRVVIVCGKGNNAGDGFVIARHLDLVGVVVEVVLCCNPDELQGDALANYQLLPHTRATVVKELDACLFDNLRSCDWVLDALLGTGAKGAPRPPFRRAIELMNACRARKLAVDISSGLDADTGVSSHVTFRADLTCTFAAAKPGLLVAESQSFVGDLQIVDIGVPSRLLARFRIGD
ncbi:MAG: NAD(P)H-hydrate epimerase [Planctomycetaceae bacterium]|nr:NAD(P)H-hydrate epimerase [Planctomycetaceae bacterium]